MPTIEEQIAAVERQIEKERDPREAELLRWVLVTLRDFQIDINAA